MAQIMYTYPAMLAHVAEMQGYGAAIRTVGSAVSTEQAFQEVRDARTTGGMAQRRRDERGMITSEEEERRVDEARSRERELTRPARCRFAASFRTIIAVF